MRRLHLTSLVAAAVLVTAQGLDAQTPDTTAAVQGTKQDVNFAFPTAGVRHAYTLAPDYPAGTPHREPLVAGVLGVLPGLGHVYASEPRRGALVFAVWFGSSMLAFSSSNKVASGAGGVVMLGAFGFSIVDASRAAGRFNRRHASPSPPPRVLSDST